MNAIELEEIKAVIRHELSKARSTPKYLPPTEASEVLGYRDRVYPLQCRGFRRGQWLGWRWETIEYLLPNFL